MLNLREYRRKSKLLADYLPWAALVAPGVVLNKDGSFQRTFRFRGPDLESATEAELVATCARVNNVLRRFGSGWALFFEAERTPAPGYPKSRFPDKASWIVDEERRAAFEDSKAVHYQSVYHLTFLYLPAADQVSRAEGWLLEAPHGGKGPTYRDHLAAFMTETDRAFDLLSGVMAEIEPLDDAGTLTYLHAAASMHRHPVAVPDTPMYLDAILLDKPLTGGLEPMLGELHLRTLSVLGFPNLTRPGLLDDLNHLAIPYRWMTRFVPLDKTEATKALQRLRKQWFGKRKSVTALLREIMYNEPTRLLDSDAENKAADADTALQELGSDQVAFGYLTATVVVADESASAAADKLRAIERVIQGRGFTTIRETTNTVEAWLGSLPGHVYANVRQPLVHTLNLAHLMPLSAVWAGPEGNDHLKGPPLLYADTGGATPFRLSTHVGDVGHMMIIGPTGSGKSVLLALMAMQFRRYPWSQVYIFDKGFSAQAATLAMDGEHHVLGAGGSLALQPLARIDDPAERSWAAEWIAGLLGHEKVTVTPEVKETVWSALLNLASAPREERTITGLSVLLQSNALKAALIPYTLEGPFGRLLDAAKERLIDFSVQCFEMEELMHEAGVVLPVLTYLFHRLEERFGRLVPGGREARPTLLILDEAWVFLDHPVFAARIREWLKTLRKKNVAVVFATQSLADVINTSIAPALIESCPQRIFLANDRAIEPQSRTIYERFGLNERQIELIASASPKREYYLQSRQGNRWFELGLGPVALSFCGTSSPECRADTERLWREDPAEGFAAALLRQNGLDWAADLAKDPREWAA